MKKCCWAIGGVLALALLCSAANSPAADEKTPPDEKAVVDSKAGGEAVFDMKEISLYDEKERMAIPKYAMYGGVNAMLTTKPFTEVKAYPKLNSKQPLYGAIALDRNPRKPGSATKFYFVFDESVTSEKVEEKAPKPDAGKPAARNRPKNRYDRLYFDVNRDLDLTNDAAIAPMKDPPKALQRFTAGPQTTVIFNTIGAPLGEDPKAKGSDGPCAAGDDALRKLRGSTDAFMPASALKGEIRLGQAGLHRVSRPASGMIGRMDRPNTLLTLTPVDGPKPPGFYPLHEYARRHPRVRRRVLSNLGHAFRRSTDGSPVRRRARRVRVVGRQQGDQAVGYGRHPRLEDPRPWNLLLGEMGYPYAGRAGHDRYVSPSGRRLPAFDSQRWTTATCGSASAPITPAFRAPFQAGRQHRDPQGQAVRARFCRKARSAVFNPRLRERPSSRETRSGWAPCSRFPARV